jgi:hypothetical protein
VLRHAPLATASKLSLYWQTAAHHDGARSTLSYDGYRSSLCNKTQIAKSPSRTKDEYAFVQQGPPTEARLQITTVLSL